VKLSQTWFNNNIISTVYR